MKKIISKFLLVAFGGVLVTVAGCQRSIDDFGDINTDPNNTTSPNTAALLTNVLSGLGGYVWGGATSINGGLYCQYMSETQYTDASRYTKPTTNEDGYYSGALYDLQNIINFNTEKPEIAGQNGSINNQIAIARILKAFIFKNLTDTWGDLPYSEALQGKGDVVYDKQEAIYPALINELKEAAAQFDDGNAVKGDILFNSDVARWKKFANSLRAILALRMSKVNPALGKTEFGAAIAAGVIESVSDNARLDYPGGNYRNPVYNYYVITQRFDYAISKTMTDKLSSMNDPRITKYGHTSKGFPYGLTRTDAIAWATANPDYGFLFAYTNTPETMPVHIISAAEVFLARAEAAKLGWTGDVAATMYINGVTAGLNQWGITGSAVTTYLAQASVLLNGTNDLQKIATQRWIASYPDGGEGWAEWRRTGFPALTPAPGAGLPIPRRMPYGPNDLLYNEANYKDAASRYASGGEDDSQNARIWWDK